MSIITKAAKNSTSTTTPSEFDGAWINVGITVKNDDGSESFIRLSRGIAVGDLKPKKVYPNMSPEFAAQVKMENQMLAEIQAAALKLGEGESLSTDALGVQLYRRNEEVAEAPAAEVQTLGLFD